MTFQKDGISYCMDLPACWRTQTKICTQCTLYTVQVAGLGIGIEAHPSSSQHKQYGRAGCTVRLSAFDQFLQMLEVGMAGTGMKKKADAGAGPVP